MNRIPLNYTSTDKVMIIHPDGSISYEPNVRYQQPTIIRRTYRTTPKARYQYMIEQVNFNKIFFLRMFSLHRKENHIVVVNGVDIGVHVNVLYVIFVIEY
jgi:hypothetical protein